ncbi:hypothetical protein F5144DRAFT_230424 [Chaetomium tenue]|uniref:Uncharacterized protein n=1 Tax=Chaetomium tenue TaxID=1854479 RepID=A0ACB7P679_9PEZI|nr:hypothetical protein F5144DRAFT_230424 [Chaetomium globosum]
MSPSQSHFHFAFRFSWAVSNYGTALFTWRGRDGVFYPPRPSVVGSSFFFLGLPVSGWPRLGRTGPNGRIGMEWFGRLGWRRRRMMDGWMADGGRREGAGGLSYPYPYLPTYPYPWDFCLPFTPSLSCRFFLFYPPTFSLAFSFFFFFFFLRTSGCHLPGCLPDLMPVLGLVGDAWGLDNGLHGGLDRVDIEGGFPRGEDRDGLLWDMGCVMEGDSEPRTRPGGSRG